MIRAAGPTDAAAIAAIYAPYVLDGYATFEQVPPDVAEMGARMSTGLPWLVAERDGRVVGYAYAAPHHIRVGYRWSVNVSVYLAVPEQGQGTGRRLYDVLLPLLRDLGFVNAFAGVALPNEPSVCLHEAVGFTPVGVFRHAGFKQGAWRDVGWWQLALRETPAAPTSPQPWETAR